MIIDCISDLHGHYPELEGGDLLIVAGDYSGNGSYNEHLNYCEWLRQQKYKCKIWIAGNHDNYLLKLVSPYKIISQDVIYLCDSGTEFEGLKIWGSPWTERFEGMNPNCMAFTVDTEEELEEKFSLIPRDVDILITHSPPFTILDLTTDGRQVGSISLMSQLFLQRTGPKLWVVGHIHESYGKNKMNWSKTVFVNASHVNEYYEPVNKPIRVIL